MQSSRAVVLVMAVLVAVVAPVLFSSTLFASGEFVPVRRVEDVLQLRDGERVDLDCMIVKNVFGPYLFVRDAWDSQTVLPVYANTFVERWWSLRVLGRTATVYGSRILVAERISLYQDAAGQPFIMMPPNMRYPGEWPYTRDLPLGYAAAPGPPPPDPGPDPPEREDYEPDPGTIVYAKL